MESDNPLVNMLAESQDAIGRAIVILLRAQGCPERGPFIAIDDWVRDDQGRAWMLCRGPLSTLADRVADNMNAAYRLGRASALAEGTA